MQFNGSNINHASMCENDDGIQLLVESKCSRKNLECVPAARYGSINGISKCNQLEWGHSERVKDQWITMFDHILSLLFIDWDNWWMVADMFVCLSLTSDC